MFQTVLKTTSKKSVVAQTFVFKKFPNPSMQLLIYHLGKSILQLQLPTTTSASKKSQRFFIHFSLDQKLSRIMLLMKLFLTKLQNLIITELNPRDRLWKTPSSGTKYFILIKVLGQNEVGKISYKFREPTFKFKHFWLKLKSNFHNVILWVRSNSLSIAGEPTEKSAAINLLETRCGITANGLRLIILEI